MYAEPATVNRADVTHKIELTLFFNGGERHRLFLWTESWDLTGVCSLSPLDRQASIIEARLPLLVQCASVVKCKLTGEPVQRMNRPGTAAGFMLFPFEVYTLRNSGFDTSRAIRAIPKELVNTSTGNAVLSNFSRALNQTGAVVWRDDERIPIRRVENLEIARRAYNKLKVVRLKDMKDDLGSDWADQVWEATKP